MVQYASSMSDHTPVLSNMFEEWTKKSEVLHISFVSFVINYWLLNARFYSYSVGPSWNMLALSTLGDYSRCVIVGVLSDYIGLVAVLDF